MQTAGSIAGSGIYNTSGRTLLESSAIGSTRFRLNDGNSEGPRKSDWGRHVSTRQTQGVVTVNIDVDKSLLELRQGLSKRLDDAQRLGAAGSAAELNIHEHELLFGTKALGGGRAGGGAAYGFSSFAGVNTSAFASQDDFEDNLRFLGRAKIDYYFDSQEQGDHGVSSQIRGACSTAARCVREIFIGDKLRWRAPHIDRDVRARELRDLHVPFDMQKEKLLAIIEPVTYADVHRLPQRAYARYLEELQSQRGADGVRTRAGGAAGASARTRHVDRLVRFAITYLRAAGMFKAYAAIAVLVEKGIVTIQANTAASTAADYQAALRGANEPLQRESRVPAEQAERLVGLAYMLDLVDARASDEGWLRPASTLIGDIVETQSRGLAEPGTSAYARLPLSRFVRAAAGAAGTKFAKDGDLDRMQVNAVRREVQAFADTKRREDEKIFGVALNHCFPGGILDYVS